jgi:hypothetical protein
MEKLIAICAGRRRFVYYVLPDLGTTAELASARAVLPSSWLLDVAQIPPGIRPPTIGYSSRQRKSGNHYIDLKPPTALIHSEPHRVQVTLASRLATEEPSDAGLSNPAALLDAHDETFGHGFSRIGAGAIVLPAATG